MVSSRLNRFEEKKATKRLILALVGTMAIITFLLVFGLKILVSFSLLVDKLRGGTPISQTAGQSIILPPTLDPLPEATNSSQLKISGQGQAGFTVIVYINGKETKKVTIDKDGTFTTTTLAPQEGSTAISAKVIDDKGNTSDLSQVMTITILKKAPLIEVTNPEDNASFAGDDNKVTVSGKVEGDVQVTVNDRFVVVKSDGSFSYSYPLSEGDTILRVIAADTAGNQTKIERKVTYKK